MNKIHQILSCPETQKPLVEAPPDVVAEVNSRIAIGTALAADGRPVKTPIKEGLIREDRAVLYPVRDGIPILLKDEGILIAGR